MSVWVCGFFVKLHLACAEQIMIEMLPYSMYLYVYVQDEIVGRRSASNSSVATSFMDDTSPESAPGKKSESGIISAPLSQLSHLLN